MAEIYGEGSTTVPGLLIDGEPVHGSRADPRAPRDARARAGALPRADRRRRARGRALGRRGAAGPRPPAAVGRAALPPRGAGQLRRRRPAGPGRHRLRDPLRAARAGSTTGSPPSGSPRTSRACPPSSTTSTRSPSRARSAATAQRRRPADRRDAARAARRRRPAPADRGARGRARRPRVFPDYPGDIPAGAFPAGMGAATAQRSLTDRSSCATAVRRALDDPAGHRGVERAAGVDGQLVRPAARGSRPPTTSGRRRS